jgi:hypothetical protein
MRLIDADALIPMMKYATTDNEIGVFPIRIGFDAIKRVIDDAPTIDAVEVVRCKDCKHKYVSGNGTTQYYVCDFMDAQYEENGFCHHAESEVGE